MMSKRNLACEGRQGTPQRFSRRINVMDSILGNPWDHHLKFTYMECIAYFIFKMGSIKLGHPTPSKFNSSPLKNGGWKEDKPFLLGRYIYRGELLNFSPSFGETFFPKAEGKVILKRGPISKGKDRQSFNHFSRDI